MAAMLFAGSLAVAPGARAFANLVPNPSVEVPDPGDPTRPLGWETNAWGGVAADFTYASGAAAEGQRSLRVVVTVSAAEGDGKWLSLPFAVPGGGRYRVADRFRSNAASELLVLALGDAGESQWIPVTTVAPAAAWSTAAAEITLPGWTRTVRVAHVLRVVGWLETDAFSMTEADSAPDGGTADGTADDAGVAPPPPLVSVTFDDGWVSAYVHAVPVMTGLGLRGSHYIVAGWIDRPGYQGDHMGSSKLRELLAAGHELGSHSLEHEDMTELSAQALERDLIQSKHIIEGLGTKAAGFVPPGGAFNATVVERARAHYHYLRGVAAGLNAAPFTAFDLRCMVVLDSTTLDELAAWVRQATDEQAWLILVYHRVGQQAPADTFVTAARFREDMEHLVQVGARVLPVGEVLGVWKRPAPPPPVQTGKPLPAYALPRTTGDGCSVGASVAPGPSLTPWALLALAAAAQRRRRPHLLRRSISRPRAG